MHTENNTVRVLRTIPNEASAGVNGNRKRKYMFLYTYIYYLILLIPPILLDYWTSLEPPPEGELCPAPLRCALSCGF